MVWTDAGSAEHAYEMDTSELNRTSILLAALALTTDRSMYPGVISHLRNSAADNLRPKLLDRTGPVTEVLILDRVEWLSAYGLIATTVPAAALEQDDWEIMLPTDKVGQLRSTTTVREIASQQDILVVHSLATAKVDYNGSFSARLDMPQYRGTAGWM